MRFSFAFDPTASRRIAAGILAALILLPACFGRQEEPAVEELPPGGSTDGRATQQCAKGWTVPAPGSSQEEKAIEVIRRTMGFEDDLVIDEMRFFEGPDSPPIKKPFLAVVRRWYVKGSRADAPDFRGRWLVEERGFGAGLAAVAPYETTEYRSPDWTGFQYEAADPARKRYPGLPGRWSGTPYDFVEGGAGLRIPGLPENVAGCLAGT